MSLPDETRTHTHTQLILIPPILLEAGYTLDKTYFFNSIGTILLYAIVGTSLNVAFTGICVPSTDIEFSYFLY